MKIDITYKGEPITIVTSTDDPDTETTYGVEFGVSEEAIRAIQEVTITGLGAFGHLLDGSVNNRDFVSALSNDPRIKVTSIDPEIEPYVFPEGAVS